MKQIPGPWEEEKFFSAGANDTVVTATNFTYAMDLTRDLDGCAAPAPTRDPQALATPASAPRAVARRLDESRTLPHYLSGLI